MFEFLGRKKSTPPTSSPASQPAAANADDSAFDSTRRRTSSQRELTRVLLRDMLNQNGIPADWMTCEAIPLAGKAGFLIQVILLHWHESLMTYAPLLQQQLLQGLQRFDPDSKHVVVWRFARDCGYPHASLPAAEFWTQQSAVPGIPKFDLPATARDLIPPDDDHGHDDFAPTEPGEFR